MTAPDPLAHVCNVTERERRAYNRGLEAAACFAELYADENGRMAHDTVMLDPVLQRHDVSPAALADSRRLEDVGAVHLDKRDAGVDLAALIRGLKVQASKRCGKAPR